MDKADRYALEVERVAQELLSLFAENLHLEDSYYFKNVFGSDPMNSMRMNVYPAFPKPDLVVGLYHGGGLTLLLQDDETVGLHVWKNNQWIPMEPIPHALVINIGGRVEVIMPNRSFLLQIFHFLSIYYLSDSSMVFHDKNRIQNIPILICP